MSDDLKILITVQMVVDSQDAEEGGQIIHAAHKGAADSTHKQVDLHQFSVNSIHPMEPPSFPPGFLPGSDN